MHGTGTKSRPWQRNLCRGFAGSGRRQCQWPSRQKPSLPRKHLWHVPGLHSCNTSRIHGRMSGIVKEFHIPHSCRICYAQTMVILAPRHEARPVRLLVQKRVTQCHRLLCRNRPAPHPCRGGCQYVRSKVAAERLLVALGVRQWPQCGQRRLAITHGHILRQSFHGREAHALHPAPKL